MGIATSLLSFLYHVTDYHLLIDGADRNIRLQLKVLPYYLIHCLFRSFVVSLAAVYWLREVRKS